MALYVVKFGGTSVANPERINHAAQIISSYIEQGHQIIVVVSAMAGATNQLLNFANVLGGTPCHNPLTKNNLASEFDTIAASGEQVTAGLMALALQRFGYGARSYLGSQIKIHTTSEYTNARILSVNTHVLKACLEQGIVPVLAGFQGVCEENNEPWRITTLGRGGSDTTAVAIAAAMKADHCCIYTDVEGVYSADPRLVPTAIKRKTIPQEIMLELATHGAKVLHHRSVELAIRFGVELSIISSFVTADGTVISVSPQLEQFKRFMQDTNQQERGMEMSNVSAIAHSMTHACVSYTVPQVPEHVASCPFTKLLNDLYAYCQSHVIQLEGLQMLTGGHLSFLVAKTDVDTVLAYLHTIEATYGLGRPHVDPNIVTVTLAGLAIARDAALIHTLFTILNENAIPLLRFQATETKISLTVSYDHMPKILTLLHDNLIS